MLTKPGKSILPGIVSNKLSQLELLTTILAIFSIFLLIALLFLSHVINLSPTGPLLPSEKNSYAFARLYKLNDSSTSIINENIGKVSIYPEMKSSSNPSAFIKGIINGLKPGASHGLLILENTNFLIESKESDGHLFHFNPTGSLTHNCKKDSNLNNNVEGHMGDLGNIIANENGQANIDKYIVDFNVNLIYGRVIVVLKTQDICDSENFYLQKEEILAYGVLGIYSEDNEQIELKRQLIEKKKKNLFKFKEKVISNEAQIAKEEKNNLKKEEIIFDAGKKENDNFIMNIKNNEYNRDEYQKQNINEAKNLKLNKDKPITTVITKNFIEMNENIPEFDQIDQKKSIEPIEKISDEFKKKDNEANFDISQNFSVKNKENNDKKSLFEKKLEPNIENNSSEPILLKNELSKSNEILNESIFNFSENSNKIEKNEKRLINNKKKIMNASQITNKLPEAYLNRLKARRKTLFMNKDKENSLFKNLKYENQTGNYISNASNSTNISLQETNNINSIFEKLSTIIDSTDKSTEKLGNMFGNPNIFVGIDLGNKEEKQNLHQNDHELKHFQKKFEQGVQDELHSKLKNLEEKI